MNRGVFGKGWGYRARGGVGASEVMCGVLGVLSARRSVGSVAATRKAGKLHIYVIIVYAIMC